MSNLLHGRVVSQQTLIGGELECDIDIAKQSSFAAQKLSYQPTNTQENNTF